jgi:hypothetical protein
LVFEVLEHFIGGFIHGKDLAGVFQEIISTGWDELLARALMILFAFVPFFAFTEIGRVLGEGKLNALFLKTRAPAKTGRPADKPGYNVGPQIEVGYCRWYLILPVIFTFAVSRWCPNCRWK